MLHSAPFATILCLKLSKTLLCMQANTTAGITNNMYIFLLGLLTACWSFTGYDASVHLIEETIAADATAGWPILYAIGISFAIGLVYLLSITVCIQVKHASLLMTTSS